VDNDCERREKKMFEEMTLAELLKEIEEKRGPYNRDPLTHAENCIEHMSLCAKELRKRLEMMFKFATKYRTRSDYPADAKLIEKILGDEKKPWASKWMKK
jgi:hypothetical protein